MKFGLISLRYKDKSKDNEQHLLFKFFLAWKNALVLIKEGTEFSVIS